tara:strand:+ start:65 stop:265 length:201 start_codon:yes stop_codon:yes gene_type:complete
MKILIWIKREDAVSGSINKYYTYLPFNETYQDWVQVEITQDKFAQLEDGDENILSVNDSLPGEETN